MERRELSHFRTNDYLKEKRSIVDQALEKYFKPESSAEAESAVLKAMAYSLFSGGKRLRPILALTTAETFTDETSQLMPLACAIEMVHTYSLIHDDLPALDNDTLRRGRATCHIAFGVETAVLAGIGLLQKALSVCLSAAEHYPENAPALYRAARHIFHAAGLDGMVGGQVADILAEKKKVNLSEITYIHSNKTAAMIEASVASGCILFCREPLIIKAFHAFGRKLGIAFQIIDDILDILSETSVLGKNAKSDLERGKATYPALVGIEQSKKDARQLIEDACNSIVALGLPVQPLVEIARYVYERKM